ncbi:DNA breaking-rejoining protein [Yersinia massiliensis]|uniref:DNA breaking-rejoining protein n=1 Tax=Yersinia TaxID=629 RepID=UPI001CFEA46B|nr:DNA breaking-rejoining protein [Yersinia massiliensis]MCB5320299.1 DNA breaking-rejoining protein [Yersinia massiliensis]MDA5547643.1 DNA breaking-rejoining protein [Yersinia massiliensis]UZM78044.1 DNA breaking-rejoining protein [Yersinia massiliensis]
MANAFERLVVRMDLATVERMGKPVLINEVDYIAVESHLIPEMGPVTGDGISLVIFSLDYSPRRNDQVTWEGQSYIVTRHQSFNGKPQIWLE